MATATTGTTPRVLARMRSETDGELKYEIRLGRDSVEYCTCMAWRMSKESPKSCKHLRRYYREMMQGGVKLELEQTLAAQQAAQRPALAPCWTEATDMVTAMHRKVRAQTGVNWSPAVMRLMTEVLTAQLQVFAGAQVLVAAPVARAGVEYDEGVRIITFADTD